MKNGKKNASIDSIFSQSKMGLIGTIIVIIFSISFTFVNILLSIVLLNHSYQLSIYPSFLGFSLVYYALKKRLPSKRIILSFITLYSLFNAALLALISVVNGVRFSLILFLEPAFFLPIVLFTWLIGNVIDGSRFQILAFIIIGGFLVILGFILAFPNNSIVAIFQPASEKIDLLDSIVPSDLVYNIFLFYHVPLIVTTGCASMLLGLVLSYMKMEIRDISFFKLLICVIFSVYIIGFPLAWHVLKQMSRDDVGRD